MYYSSNAFTTKSDAVLYWASSTVPLKRDSRCWNLINLHAIPLSNDPHYFYPHKNVHINRCFHYWDCCHHYVYTKRIHHHYTHTAATIMNTIATKYREATEEWNWPWTPVSVWRYPANTLLYHHHSAEEMRVTSFTASAYSSTVLYQSSRLQLRSI